MKKSLFAALCLLLLCAMPADAFFPHRPFLHHAARSPLVASAVNFGAAQLMPILQDAAGGAGHPQAGSGNAPSPVDPRIYVDRSVSRNLEAATQNLKDAAAITQELLIKNKLRPAGGGTPDTPGAKGTIDNPKVK